MRKKSAANDYGQSLTVELGGPKRQRSTRSSDDIFTQLAPKVLAQAGIAIVVRPHGVEGKTAQPSTAVPIAHMNPVTCRSRIATEGQNGKRAKARTNASWGESPSKSFPKPAGPAGPGTWGAGRGGRRGRKRQKETAK